MAANAICALGIMSGTSHDGVDLCLARFEHKDNSWCYQILKAKTFEYDEPTRQKLLNAYNLSAVDFAKLNAWYGILIAERVLDFTANTGVAIDVIGSHGHTVFHNPNQGYTTQIGSGAHIAALTGIPCVCDFRSGDVARGGQGAPLVPIGDELLFSNFKICLNIGGIANLSYNQNGSRIAYDICPANLALNSLAATLGVPFDLDGRLGMTGKIIPSLLSKLQQLDYYQTKGAKSLGREWFESTFQPTIINCNSSNTDKLRTAYEHIANKISEAISITPNANVLATGGGANNTFLMRLIMQKSKCKITIPKQAIIDFKEALIFGFLAVLYLNKTPSSLASVTGAHSNSIGGCLYY